MFAVDVCGLPETGGSSFVLIVGVFLLVAGVIVARWARHSAGRLSVVVAPLVLLGGFVLAPQVADPCATTTTTVSPTTTTTTVSPTTTTTTVSPTTTTTTVSPTTTTTTTTLAPALYGVGQVGPGGGTIFYVDMARAVGSQYFEVACASWQNNCVGTTADPTPEWGCFGTSISGADGILIGTGEQNTTDIVGSCVTSDITAAELAAGYSHNSLDDWFLPSKDELNRLFVLSLTGFSTEGYWSSSEGDDSNAWGQRFDFGHQSNYYKSSTAFVRPVRAF
jgi:hypothetical protein